MPRFPKPWFRKERQAWFVQMDGRQVNLGPDRQEAIDRYHALMAQAQDIRKGLPHAVAVLSMVGQNYRLTRDMKEAADALELPLASHPLTLRQIYADAPGQGAVVWKLGAKGRDAANEIDAVFREIVPEACGRKGKDRVHAVESKTPGKWLIVERKR